MRTRACTAAALVAVSLRSWLQAAWRSAGRIRIRIRELQGGHRGADGGGTSAGGGPKAGIPAPTNCDHFFQARPDRQQPAGNIQQRLAGDAQSRRASRIRAWPRRSPARARPRADPPRSDRVRAGDAGRARRAAHRRGATGRLGEGSHGVHSSGLDRGGRTRRRPRHRLALQATGRASRGGQPSYRAVPLGRMSERGSAAPDSCTCRIAGSADSSRATPTSRRGGLPHRRGRGRPGDLVAYGRPGSSTQPISHSGSGAAASSTRPNARACTRWSRRPSRDYLAAAPRLRAAVIGWAWGRSHDRRRGS